MQRAPYSEPVIHRMISKATPPRLTTEGDDPGQDISLREVWGTVVRHRILIALTALALVVAAGIYTWMQVPAYQSVVTLRIDESNSTGSVLSSLSPVAGLSRGKIETEMRVLQSRRVTEAVVDSLNLTLRVQEPAGARTLIVIHDLPRTGGEGHYELARRSDGSYAMTATATAPTVRAPASVAVGQPFTLGTARLSLGPDVARDKPQAIVFNISPFRGTVSGVRSGIAVERADLVSHVVNVTYTSADPRVAADVPNVLAARFLEEKLSGLRSESRSTVQFLREQVSSYNEQLRLAEERVRSYRESQQVVSLTEEASEQVRRLAADQAEYDRLRSERQSLATLLAEVTAAARAGVSNGTSGTSPYRRLASFPVFLVNRAVQDMLQSLTALETRRSEVLVQRTEVDNDVQSINERIGQIEEQLLQLARSYLASLDSQIASKQSSLNRFGGELARIPSREVGFARLSREQDLLTQIYNLLQTRLKEAEIQAAAEPSDVEIIDSALVPITPISPNPVKNVGLGLILGLGLGVALAFVRQAVDTKIRSRQDVEQATSGAPVLGMIPRIRISQLAPLSPNGNGKGKAAQGGRGKHVDDVREYGPVTRRNPQSPVAESYRALRTNIMFAGADSSPRVLVVTSAFPGDGKSTSASNLAITLAQQGTRTLLVDADLRRGVLHSVFGISSDPGLSHVLLGKVPLDEAISTVSAGENGVVLDVLPTGVLPPNPAELLGHQRTRDLVETLRERYEMIIFDAPPLNLVTDAAVLGTVADATILVARNGITDRRALEHAALQLSHVGAVLGGVILNDVVGDENSYYNSGYGYTYGAYRRN